MNPARLRGQIELHRNSYTRSLKLCAVLAAAMALPCAGAQSPAPRFVVVLDAAHGGEDAGAKIVGKSGRALPEKEITLALSVKLRSLLAARGITVVTTREADEKLDAQRRAEIANHANAQACLTLHASMSGPGVHLFLTSLPQADPPRFSAWRTAQAAWVQQSVELAGVLNSALLHAGATVTMGRTALTTEDSMTCPAVAVEIAPEGTSGTLDDPDYQAKLAGALAAGLLEWRSTSPAAAPAGQDRPQESRRP